MMSCLEPDRVDEMWPPEIAALRASEELYVKAYSIEAPQIDLRYVIQAVTTLGLVIERLCSKGVTTVAVVDARDIGW